MSTACNASGKLSHLQNHQHQHRHQHHSVHHDHYKIEITFGNNSHLIFFQADSWPSGELARTSPGDAARPAWGRGRPDDDAAGAVEDYDDVYADYDDFEGKC